MSDTNDREFFFSQQVRDEYQGFVRARGWEGGHPLYLPYDCHFVKGRDVYGTYHELNKSEKMNLWYVLRYQENHSEWHGCPLEVEGADGNYHPVTNETEALRGWEAYLKKEKSDYEYYIL